MVFIDLNYEGGLLGSQSLIFQSFEFPFSLVLRTILWHKFKSSAFIFSVIYESPNMYMLRSARTQYSDVCLKNRIPRKTICCLISASLHQLHARPSIQIGSHFRMMYTYLQIQKIYPSRFCFIYSCSKPGSQF